MRTQALDNMPLKKKKSEIESKRRHLKECNKRGQDDVSVLICDSALSITQFSLGTCRIHLNRDVVFSNVLKFCTESDEETSIVLYVLH